MAIAESQREAPRDPDLSHLEMRNGRFLSVCQRPSLLFCSLFSLSSHIALALSFCFLSFFSTFYHQADFSNFKFCGSILTGAKFGDPDMKVETRMHNVDFSNADLSKVK